MLDGLLRIAGADLPARRQSFSPVPPAALVNDPIELYDATADPEGSTIISE
jgi:hypothetical protein